jgi:hypothetical protein
MKSYTYGELDSAPLVIDAIYQSKGTLFGEGPLEKLLPKSSNQGGFRSVKRKDTSGNLAYCVLYTSLEELEWPDSLDVENGIFRYYGDNRTPGRELHDTPRNGNKYLRDVFSKLDSEKGRHEIPPFLVFRKTSNMFDVQFLGIAVPSNPNISPDKELAAIWRTKDGQRFQNYEAYFSILDTGDTPISKQWLEELIDNHSGSSKYAPEAWKKFIEKGRVGVTVLTAPRQQSVPNKVHQLPDNATDRKMIAKIHKYYASDPYGFEKCATRIVQRMDNNFEQFELTRPWRDGGRDATGKYRIGTNSMPLYVECALEAKCYDESSSVGVRAMSRLISRIKHRQFGILVTTSYVDKQAYSEVVDDGHSILVITARDISNILRKNGVNEKTVDDWLKNID